MLWAGFWKSRDLVQTVEKNLDQKYVFISAKTYFENLFWNFRFQIFIEKSKISKISTKNQKCHRHFHQKFSSKLWSNILVENFEIFDFFDENFENRNFENIFKMDFRRDENIFLVQIFSTVWTKSLDFQKTVQSIRGSWSIPRQGIVFRGCL